MRRGARRAAVSLLVACAVASGGACTARPAVPPLTPEESRELEDAADVRTVDLPEGFASDGVVRDRVLDEALNDVPISFSREWGQALERPVFVVYEFVGSCGGAPERGWTYVFDADSEPECIVEPTPDEALGKVVDLADRSVGSRGPVVVVMDRDRSLVVDLAKD
ncbi:hypothetical protein [Cellulosimicrobium funkei]|uniref:hypothetical protein n=1 Tax=Cellulosimicrobium funkei TaxID=264251 RepID=UPI0037DBF175